MSMKMIRISVIVSLVAVMAGTYLYLYLKETEQAAVSASR